MRAALAPDEAHAVWDLLVAKAGASPHDEDHYAFVAYLTAEDAFPHEYRFCGLLGFGGKLHTNHHPALSVSCYREDRDEVRDAIVATVNEDLARLVPSIGARQ